MRFMGHMRSIGCFFLAGMMFFCSLKAFSSSDLEGAFNWLSSQQDSDGSWGELEKQPADTSESFITLYKAGRSGEWSGKTVNWAASLEPENTSSISKAIIILSHSTADINDLKSLLLSFQNPDGGFGIGKDYTSSPLMTIMAVRALIECGSADRANIEKAINFLCSAQQSYGGWTLQDKDNAAEDMSDIILTGWIVSSLREYQLNENYYPTNLSLAISKGISFIASKQNPDSSWDSPSDITATALCMASLLMSGGAQASVEGAAIWLENQQIADGSFTGNIYKTAIAARYLKLYYENPFPEPPDLEISQADISFSPSSPLTSYQILITVKIRNIGGSAAQNVGVQCYDGNPSSGGTKIGPELQLASIAAGSYGTVRLGVYLQAGIHEIFALADPSQRVIEGREDNNSASASVVVTPAQISQPDLAITSDNISFNIPDPSFPNQVEITALVENKGETVAANAILQFFDGTVQLGKDFVLDKVFGGGTYSFKLTTVLAPGERTITVNIDPYSQIAESNEKNNTASKKITVTNLPPAVPQNLEGSPAESTAYLSWTANTEPDLAGYNVYRNGSKLNTSALPAPYFTDTGLANSQSYLYKVSAVDLYGAESGFSPEISLTPQAETLARPVLTFPASKQTPGHLASATSDIEGIAVAGKQLGASSKSDWQSGNMNEYNQSLAAYWGFGENTGSQAVDSVQDITGSLSGLYSWRGGRRESGIHFDFDQNSWNYGYMSASVPGFGTDASFSTWIRVNPADITSYYGLGLAYSYSPSGGMWYLMINNNGSLSNNYEDWYMGGYAYTSSGALAWQADRWYNLVFTRGTSGMNIYRDGELVASSTSGLSATGTTGSLSMYIGAGYWYGGFDGDMDEIGLWNMVLTDEAAATIYSGGAGKFYPEWLQDYSDTLNVNTDSYTSPGDLKLASGATIGYNRKIYNAGSPTAWGPLLWSADTPAGTSVRFRTRTAATLENLADSTWSAYLDVSGSAVTSPADHFIEVEALLESSDPAAFPSLHAYSLTAMSGAVVDISVNGTLRATAPTVPGLSETSVTTKTDWTTGTITDYNSYLKLIWNFDENSGGTVQDLIGDADGTINGAAWSSSGKRENCLSFDGSDDHVSGMPGFDKSQPVTFNVWFKTSAGGGLFQQDYWSDSSNFWSFVPNIRATNGSLEVWAYAATGGSREDFYIEDTTGRDYRDNAWHMFTVAIDGAANKGYAYIDGTYLGTDTFNGPATWTADQDKSLKDFGKVSGYGYQRPNYDWFRHFNGQLDELTIWKNILSQQAVQDLYNSGIGKFYPGWNNNNLRIAIDGTDPFSSPGDLKLAAGKKSGWHRKIFDAGIQSVWGQIFWNADTPANTTVKFRSRSAAAIETISSSIWSPYYTASGSGIVSHSDRYIEIEALLESKDSAATPVLHDYLFGSPSGSFSAAGVQLDEGENTITAVARCGTIESEVSDPVKAYVTLGADLSIVPQDISFTPTAPGAEYPVSIVADVKNLGSGTADNFKVKFFDGDPDSGGIPLGEGFTIPSLGPSGSANLTLSTYLSAGTHSIFIFADAENTVPESDEGNNTATVSITVTPPASQPPDFEITNSGISFSSDNPTNLDIISITAIVRNVGGAKAEILKIAFFDGNPASGGIQIGDGIVFNNIAPQATATAGMQAMLPAGSHEIYVLADPDNNVSEADEANNSASKSITVSESPQSPSDLAVKNGAVSFSNSVPSATDIFTIGAEITNQGGISANNVLVRFFDGNPLQGGAQIGGDFQFSGVAPGGSAAVSLETALPAGQHRIYVYADPSNTILESDEWNNTAYADIEVQPAPLPDLFIDQSEISVPQGDIYSGDLVKISVKVRNIGEGDASRVKIRLYQGPPVGGGIRVARDAEVSLAGGDAADVVLGWCAAVGTHSLYIEADPDNLLPETDDFNNTASVTLTVLPSPDIQPVTDPEIQAAIDKGIAWLSTQQAGNGSFTGYYGSYTYGTTALAIMAMLHGGISVDDPRVTSALAYLDTYPSQQWNYITYEIALVIMAYQTTGKRLDYHQRVETLFNTLLSNYYYGGGMFTYGDLSNTQYGYLALYAASQWGIEIPESVRSQGLNRMTSGQNPDGGWDYGCSGYGGSYGAMTCAGIMNLRMLGVPPSDNRVQRGINWLNDHYAITYDPGSWWGATYYYLYSMERAMNIESSIAKIGEHDWYKDGSAFLVSQQAQDGSWNQMFGTEVSTCFALLFLERAVPEVSKSDLIVSSISFSNQNPVQGETISIASSIKNNDIRDIESHFKVAFYDGNPDQGGQQIGSDQTIQSLNGQASASVSVQWTVPTSETHTIYVLADIYNEAEETNEGNNTGTAQISVLANSGFEITVSADKDSYSPGERVIGAISVKNIGTASSSGTVEVALKDKEGNIISTLAREYFTDLAAGATHEFTRSWDISSGTAGGQYRLEASVFEGGAKKASNFDSFNVENLYGVNPGITSDRLEYPANADVVLTSRAASATSNFTYSDLKVVVTVTAPDFAEMMTNTYTVPELQPGRIDLKKLQWNTAVNPPGQYTAKQRIYDNDGTTLLSQSEAVFTITSSLESGGFAGSISVAPQTVEGGETFSISYSITNTGNVDIADAELIKIVTDRQNIQNVYTFSEPLNLEKGQTYEGQVENLASSGLTLQKYLVVLMLKKADREFSVGATYLNLVDTIPPTIEIISPANGTLTKNPNPQIRAILDDNFSGIDIETINLTIDGSKASPMYDNLTGMLVLDNPQLSDGEHALSITVKDIAGNSASTPEWKITVDATPPAIATLVPQNGALLKASPAEISAVITDALSGVKEDTITMTLDGNPATFTYDASSGKVSMDFADLADGLHTVSASASDNAGNSSTSPQWQFTVDSTPPVYSAHSPANDSISKNAKPEISLLATDALSGIAQDSISLEIDGQPATHSFESSTGRISYIPESNLSDGWHVITSTASDLAGNSSTTSWRVGIDTASPSISNLTPAPGSLIAEYPSEISASIADSFSGISESSIVLTIDGSIVQHIYDSATGKVYFAPTELLADGTHSVIISVSDNAGNSSTSPEWQFILDTVPPVINGISPEDGNISKDSEPEISATLSDALSGIDETTISLAVDGISIAASYDSATGLLTASSPLLEDGGHDILISVSDNAGNNSVEAWSIGVDTTPPQISDLSPAPGSTTSQTQPTISAKLSDSFSGINASSISLTVNGESLAFNYDSAAGILTATPAQPLQPGTIQILLSVEDNAGNSASAGSWTITVQTWLLFHNSTSGQIKISGSGKTFDGRVHSNAAIKISGSNNDITQLTTAVGNIQITGSGNDVPNKQANATPQPMPVYDFNYYQQNATYTHSGNWHISGSNETIPAGIHYVNGYVKISGSHISGNVTIVATDYIKISGSNANFISADPANRMLFFSRTGDIDISGSNAKLKGIIYAPQGEIDISGSGESLQGAAIGNEIDISGSNKSFGPLQ